LAHNWRSTPNGSSAQRYRHIPIFAETGNRWKRLAPAHNQTISGLLDSLSRDCEIKLLQHMNEDEKARFLDDRMHAEELKQIHWRASKNNEKPALENAA
jgi:hypothetical protein